MIIAGGLAVVMVLAVMLLRHRSQPVPDPTIDLGRRRGVGDGLVTQSPLPSVDVLPPRPRPALGLTPWDGRSEGAPSDEAEGSDGGDEEAFDHSTILTEADKRAIDDDQESAVGMDEGMTLGADFVIPRGLEELPPEEFDAAPEEPVEDHAPLILMTKKKRSPGAPPPYLQAAHVPREVEENVSVVLRRQVPLAAGPARSWLGGLPRLPDSVEWPRTVAPDRADEGDRPLHFVAQISCEDLPPDLWGGLGPRVGWLLFFLNPLDPEGDDPRLVRVVHVEEWGAEREPPVDLPPVDEETGPGPDYRHCRTVRDIPTRWRRWPVDLVAVPNQLYDEGNRIFVTPPDFAAQLYAGAPVNPAPAEAEADAPLSWRGALYIIDSVLRELDEGIIGRPPSPAQREVLLRENYVASIIPELRAQEEAWMSVGPGAIVAKPEPLTLRERELQARMQSISEDRQRELEKVAAFIVQNPNGEAIIARCEHDRKAEADWRAGAIAGLEAVRDQIVAQPLDTPLLPEDWEALRMHLDGQRLAGWSIEWTSRNTEFPVSLVQRTVSLLDLAEAGRNAGVVELAADYQADPALAALVPEGIRSRLEPHWRALTDNRPHRMGGYHDGLQTDPEEGPQEMLLLLQLASDDAMHWMWGDGGAYFITISPRDLAQGRFDQAEIRLELP